MVNYYLTILVFGQSPPIHPTRGCASQPRPSVSEPPKTYNLPTHESLAQDRRKRRYLGAVFWRLRTAALFSRARASLVRDFRVDIFKYNPRSPFPFPKKSVKV